MMSLCAALPQQTWHALASHGALCVALGVDDAAAGFAPIAVANVPA